jgi:hypothetical protein
MSEFKEKEHCNQSLPARAKTQPEEGEGEESYGLFTGFGSFEEMLAFVQQARANADSRVEDWQRQLQADEYFVSYSPEAELLVYSQIVAPDPDEPELLENYRLVRGYSVIVPQGELGEAHIVSAFGRLTQAQFEKARTLGWPSSWAEFATVVEDDQTWLEHLPL